MPIPDPLLPTGKVLPWRVLLALLVVGICWLAFTPDPPSQADTGWDKLNHVLAFASIGGCGVFAFSGARHLFVGVALAALAYGAFIEVVQTHIPGRSGEWPDLLADAIGIAVGMVLAWVAHRRRRVSAAASGNRLTP